MRVALFATCFNDTMWPETPKAVVRLLERLGCRVEFPSAQTCCGQMMTNTGYAGEAVPLVRHFVDVFEEYDAVVAPSGSCVGSVRDQHPMIAHLAGDPGLASEVEGVRPKVYELSEFLVDVLGVTDVGAYFPHRVTYHPTCHSLRMLRVGDRPLQLGVPGVAYLGHAAAPQRPPQLVSIGKDARGWHGPNASPDAGQRTPAAASASQTPRAAMPAGLSRPLGSRSWGCRGTRPAADCARASAPAARRPAAGPTPDPPPSACADASAPAWGRTWRPA